MSNILTANSALQYLFDYSDGKIPFGLKLGCDLDNHIQFKKSQLNMILGHDNVGKSYWIEWYYLALATNHDLKFTLFMDENFHGKVTRDLVQMYTGKPFMSLNHKEITRAVMKIDNHFKFVDNSKQYEPNQIIDIFSKEDTDVYLIDPFNALSFPMSYQNNYSVLNDLKHFTKEGKTMYINNHPSSASGRRGAVFPKGHEWENEVMPPLKSEIEGGKAFANKADDFIIIHRLTGHDVLWNQTLIEVAKIKDTDTGGKPTKTGIPIFCDYNFGLGFKIGGVDVIKRPNSIDIEKQKEIFLESEEKRLKKESQVTNDFFTNKNIIQNNNFDNENKINYVKPDDCPF